MDKEEEAKLWGALYVRILPKCNRNPLKGFNKIASLKDDLGGGGVQHGMMVQEDGARSSQLGGNHYYFPTERWVKNRTEPVMEEPEGQTQSRYSPCAPGLRPKEERKS